MSSFGIAEEVHIGANPSLSCELCSTSQPYAEAQKWSASTFPKQIFQFEGMRTSHLRLGLMWTLPDISGMEKRKGKREKGREKETGRSEGRREKENKEEEDGEDKGRQKERGWKKRGKGREKYMYHEEERERDRHMYTKS
eukprot:CAMPEP_0184480180 /NCGR_PEP_ID=MMETSP0113_2-20130426/1662_1 /TAXON_ID=91329 /ORGANISM="Norrisiella sphaerica, Strain BC52" /LENGTH=139 /DNA_ID=CAMNT_0026858469 /DNA_START=313 /DNA_END=732 /DNA_ORIENTATION=+